VVPSVKPSANIHKGREITPIPPYIPLNISSGHEKCLSVVAVCLYTTSKYRQLPLLNCNMDLLLAT